MTINKVLITGVAGLIGSHFSKYLLDNYEVYGIDNLSGGYRENIPSGVIFFEGDLENKQWLAETFKKIKPDYVYHFAAYAAEGLSPFIRNFNYTNNLLSSVNVINECIKNDVKKIIFSSSMAVYGNNRPPFTEDMKPEPIDPYGIAKYAVEMDLKQAFNQFGLKYSIVRPHNVIGIQQNIWDKYRNVLGIWITKVLKGQNITIFGDGKQTRAFSDIKFCLAPLEKLMTKDGKIFNLGSDKEYSLNETAKIFQKVANEFGYMPKIEYLQQRHEVKHAYCSHKKAKQWLDFQDKTNLKKTIEEMFGWALKQPEREVKQKDYEITKGIYGYWA